MTEIQRLANVRFRGLWPPLFLPCVVALAALACFGALRANAQEPAEFKIGESSETDTFDPYTTRTGVTGLRFSALLYEPLVRVPDPAGAAEKVLADSLYSPSLGIVRVHLDPKLLWQDNQPITSDDVLFSYEVCKSPGADQIINGNSRRKASFVESVKPLPDGWLEFAMQRGLPGSAEKYLTLPILPKHVFLRDGKFTPCMDPRNAVGSGPVKLVSAKTGANLVKFKVFQQWHGTTAMLEPLFDIILDDIARMTSLATGGVDFVAEVSPEWLSKFKGQPQTYNAVPYPSYAFESLALNFKNPLIAKSQALRQAMLLAIDRATILERIYAQEGAVVNGPFTPATGCQSPKSDPYDFNPQKALDLLKGAGFVRGGDGMWSDQGKPIKFNLVSYVPSGESQRKQVLTAIRGNLKDIGIDIEVTIRSDVRQWQEDVFVTGKFDMTLITWEYDPAGMVGDLFHTRGITTAEKYNFISYSNPATDRIIEAYERSRNRFEKSEYCTQLDKALNEDLPYLFLWTTKKNAVFYARSRDYRNFRIIPLTIYDTFGQWYAQEK